MSKPLQVYLEERELARLAAWARARGWTKSQAIRAAVRALTRSRVLDRFEASPLTLVEFATAEHHRAARVWLERLADRAISYTDAVSFAVMEATRCAAVLSFDRDFERAGFRLWRAGAQR